MKSAKPRLIEAFARLGIPLCFFAVLIANARAAAPVIWSFAPASGPAGTSVAILGRNFTGATAVKFNGAAASFTVASPTRILATAPSGAASGTVTVTASGRTAASEARFAVSGTNVQYQASASSAAVSLNGVTGRTLTLLKITADPSITIQNCSDITILACDVRSIVITNSTNVRVYNCFIHDSANTGVGIDGCSNVTVQGNRMERIETGVYAQDCPNGGIQVLGNCVLDVQGPIPRGQLAQFNNVGTKAANAVSYNYGINHRGQSQPEDMISMFQSRGTAAAPILIEGNYLTGDPVDGSEDKSESGSGIMLGDYGGKYLLCRNNVLLSPGQCGIGVAGGSNITVAGNMIMGLQSNVSNIGTFVWYVSGGHGSRITLKYNTVAWTHRDGYENDYWNGGGFSRVKEGPDSFGDWAAFNPLPVPPTTAPLPPLPHGNPAIYPAP